MSFPFTTPTETQSPSSLQPTPNPQRVLFPQDPTDISQLSNRLRDYQEVIRSYQEVNSKLKKSNAKLTTRLCQQKAARKQQQQELQIKQIQLAECESVIVAQQMKERVLVERIDALRRAGQGMSDISHIQQRNNVGHGREYEEGDSRQTIGDLVGLLGYINDTHTQQIKVLLKLVSEKKE